MKTIKIIRDWQDLSQTLGKCTVYDEHNKPLFNSMSLERGWRDNESRVSCVPIGTYTVVLEYSNRFKKDLWELKNVDNRSECKFHSANYWFQLNGCIALGRSLADINNDGYQDVTSSKSTMKSFHKALKGETKVNLIITDGNGCQCK
tara:strand:+ start:235 stop:675 length:441 start_codon:yes stop_codon:yes gene_type:complete